MKRVTFQLYTAFDVTFCTVSILHLCAVSIDRYYAIVKVTHSTNNQMANKRIEKLKNTQLTNAITYVFNSMMISSNVKQFKVVFVNNVPLCLFFYRTFVFFFSVPKWLGEVCFPNNPPIDMLDCHEKRTWKNPKSNHI